MTAFELPETIPEMGSWLDVERAFERYAEKRTKARAQAEMVRSTQRTASEARMAFRVARAEEVNASEAYDRARAAWHARQDEKAAEAVEGAD